LDYIYCDRAGNKLNGCLNLPFVDFMEEKKVVAEYYSEYAFKQG
jgi:hypothetical protein